MARLLNLYIRLCLMWACYGLYMQAKINKEAEVWKFIPVFILNLLFFPVCVYIAYKKGNLIPK